MCIFLIEAQTMIAQMSIDDWLKTVNVACNCLKWYLEVKAERKRPESKQSISDPKDQM